MTVPTLERVLRELGPHANGGPPQTDEELMAQLEACGREARQLPRLQRQLVAELWTEFLTKECLPPIPNAWKVVRLAFDGNDPGVRAWQWHTAAELEALPPPAELVRGHLTAGSLVVLYGPRGLGKTFLALDLACTIDAGAAWHGCAVQQGPAAYVLAEGRGGLARRVRAWADDHGARPGVRFLTQAVRLLEAGDVEQLVRDLHADPPALLVVDTLARCLAPGDENSTQDMGAAVAALDRVREATGATVLALHHTGHDKTRERGSTALGAAADTVLAVSRDADVLTLTCEKQRDALEFLPLRFRLHPVGESVVPRLVLGGDGLSGADRQALEALQAIAVEEGVPISHWDSSANLGHGQLYRSRAKLLGMGLVRTERTGRQVRYWPAVAENGDGGLTP